MESCKICGCTDEDCRQCIQKTGMPCHWVGPNLCSACVSGTVAGNSDSLEDSETEFAACSRCDGHDACEDFGCAILQGIKINQH